MGGDIELNDDSIANRWDIIVLMYSCKVIKLSQLVHYVYGCTFVHGSVLSRCCAFLSIYYGVIVNLAMSYETGLLRMKLTFVLEIEGIYLCRL